MGPGEAWTPPELGRKGQGPPLFTPGAITSPAWVPPSLEPIGSKAQLSTAQRLRPGGALSWPRGSPALSDTSLPHRKVCAGNTAGRDGGERLEAAGWDSGRPPPQATGLHWPMSPSWPGDLGSRGASHQPPLLATRATRRPTSRVAELLSGLPLAGTLGARRGQKVLGQPGVCVP